jgi:ribonuclease HI
MENCIGGYGFVIIDVDKKKIVKSSGGSVEGTTNNRMELSAAIQGLQDLIYLKNNNVSKEKCAVLTDSNYIVNNWYSYIEDWIKNDFKKSSGGKVLNDDLWRLLYKLSKKFEAIKFKWVKGHGRSKFNIMADTIATDYISKYKRSQNALD